MALFLMRQPATIWLRVRQGRGRKADGPVVARLTLGLGGLALLCLLGLLALGLLDLLWLALPVTALLVAYVLAALGRQTSTRTLWMELVGAAGLALTAPAAYIAAAGHVAATAWWLWGLMALQNVVGVFYVRLRLADTHQRSSSRWPMLAAHGVALAAVLVAGAFQSVPPMTVLPFVAFLLRAIWAFTQSRPIPNVKKFGFTEVGVEVASGLTIILAYSL
jgi:hypothetical protein